jgi:Phosphoribosyl transferase domain
VAFDAASRYAAAYAIRALESTPEFMKAAGLHHPPNALILGVPFGADHEDMSGLPPMLEGVTVGEALDIIATTFGGIVVYGECKDNPRAIDIHFFGFPRRQGGRSGSGRRRNAAAAFAAPKSAWPRLAGKRVLLVDDVITTGATAEACARALKGAGAACVHVAAVARVQAPDAAPI